MTSNVKRRGTGGAKASPALLLSPYRSRLEEKIAAQLTKAGIKFVYEGEKLRYTVPKRETKYTPDFPITSSKPCPIVIEAKGRFRTAAERQKLILVREQHPDIDLRIVFQKASNPIYKGSKTTYAMWAESHGIPWADGGTIPLTWIQEMTDGSVQA